MITGWFSKTTCSWEGSEEVSIEGVLEKKKKGQQLECERKRTENLLSIGLNLVGG